MRLSGADTHLTYCLNIHPGEMWEECFEDIRLRAAEIRNRVAGGLPFGLGLRLGAAAAGALAAEDKLTEFKDFLDRQGMYVFTINGFPYGGFHGKRVKDGVFRPDWTDERRVYYTMLLGDILSRLLPEGMYGSISTVPLTYRPWGVTDAQKIEMTVMLMRCVEHLARICEVSGKEIRLALEPEPDCLLQSSCDVVSFFTEYVFSRGAELLRGRFGRHSEDIIRRHLGICFDTCHFAVQFEDLKEAAAGIIKAGVSIPKVQLGSALAFDFECDSFTATAQQFTDDVYLHQVRVCCGDGGIVSFSDLDDASIRRISDIAGRKRCRVHCHMPLYFTHADGVGSTSALLDADLIRIFASSTTQHLEIETYTYDVLPPSVRAHSVEDHVVKEYRFALERLAVSDRDA